MSKKPKNAIETVNWRPETAEEEARIMEHLEPEEREFLEAYNAGEYDFQPLSPERQQQWEEAARDTLALREQLTLHLTTHDLTTLKGHAAREGLTPGVLAASILHKYLSGQLSGR